MRRWQWLLLLVQEAVDWSCMLFDTVISNKVDNWLLPSLGVDTAPSSAAICASSSFTCSICSLCFTWSPFLSLSSSFVTLWHWTCMAVLPSCKWNSLSNRNFVVVCGMMCHVSDSTPASYKSSDLWKHFSWSHKLWQFAYVCHRCTCVPTTRTQLGRRSFHIAAPAVRNALPSQLHSSSISRGQLSWAGLKTHLFTQAYRQTPLRTFVEKRIVLHLHFYITHASLLFLLFVQASSLSSCLQQHWHMFSWDRRRRVVWLCTAVAVIDGVDVCLALYRYCGKDDDRVGLYVAAEPLTRAENYFEVEIIDAGVMGAIGKCLFHAVIVCHRSLSQALHSKHFTA